MRLLAAAIIAAAIMGAAAAATPEPSVAVAVVACGRLAGEALFGMCVRSLRGPGAFAGAIYALTDRPACAPATTTVVAVSAERDGLFGLECRRRAAKPSRPPAQVPVRVEPRCQQGASILYKQLKMRLLDVVREDVVWYVDVDVVAGAPVGPLVAAALAAFRDPATTLAAYDEAAVTADAHDRTRLLREPYHGGVFFAHRTRSARCLRAWGARVAAAIPAHGRAVKRSSIRDQPLLAATIREGACVVAPLPPATLSKPSRSTIEGGRYAVLNHLSRSSRLKGKRNMHNLTRAHLARLGADLLGVRGARGNWWAAPAACAPRGEDGGGDADEALVLGCGDG